MLFRVCIPSLSQSIICVLVCVHIIKKDNTIKSLQYHHLKFSGSNAVSTKLFLCNTQDSQSLFKKTFATVRLTLLESELYLSAYFSLNPCYIILMIN